jgi:hypothetical protein
MAFLIAKKKANQLYYYVIESAVSRASRASFTRRLGTAKRVAALVKDRTAPVPVAASTIDFGLTGASGFQHNRTGVLALL